MSNVTSIDAFKSKKKDGPKKDEPKKEMSVEEIFLKVMKRNGANLRRMENDRKSKNKNVLRSYRIK